MKRSVVVTVFVMSMVVAAVRAQEKPAVQPAAPPATQPAAPAATPAVQPAVPAAPAAAQPAAPSGEDIRQQLMALMKQINALEREARKNDPTLNGKLADLEKQRRQIFIQAKPELEALYAQQEVIMETVKATWGKNAGQGVKVKPGAEAKAEKAAEKATQK